MSDTAVSGAAAAGAPAFERPVLDRPASDAAALPAGPGPAETRGRLRVDDRVVERIAAQACLSVPEVVASAGRLPGRHLPRARVEVGASRLDVSVDVAVTWPADLARVAERIHDAIVTTVDALLGRAATRADVRIVTVTTPTAPARRVR